MEPWLDSLSEDWKSEHQSSSLSLPHGTPDPSLRSNSRNSHSKSRIPRRSSSIHSQSSIKSNYLRPRSQKGLARSKESPALGEHSSSQLNIAANEAEYLSKGASNTESKENGQRSPNGRSTLPRRTSATFSESLQSVQHHTIGDSAKRKNLGGTLEWKRRLANNNNLSGAGGDMFGPTKLEGMFQQPKTTFGQIESDPLGSSENTRPWSLPLNSSDSSRHHSQTHVSMRASRNRIPEMEVLEEENEDESNSEKLKNSADGQAEQNSGESINGEDMPRRTKSTDSSSATLSQNYVNNDQYRLLEFGERDPRTRTLSGMEEIRNEGISPITVSRTNTINMYPGLGERNTPLPQTEGTARQKMNSEIQRPSSASSDSAIYRRGNDSLMQTDTKNELLADLTSNSLPDDLSMGTQDFVARGGFVNTRRGGLSNENSFLRRNLSSSSMPGQASSGSVPTDLHIRSSPPPSTVAFREAHSGILTPVDRLATPEPADGQLNSTPSPTKSIGSPLKLFGNYDTFTNNRLLTRIGQFEDKNKDNSAQTEGENVVAGNPSSTQTLRLGGDSQLEGEEIGEVSQSHELRMSQFGKGDLDQYPFSQKVSHASSDSRTHEETRNNQDGRIFDFSPDGTPEGAFLNQKGRYKPTSLPKVRKDSSQPGGTRIDSKITRNEQSERIVTSVETHEQKRGLHSPGKERTPKRRRTLISDEAMGLMVRDTVRDINDPVQVAGRKRKDARYDTAESIANPEVLATRQMLRPKPTQRQSSSQRVARTSANDSVLSKYQAMYKEPHDVIDSEEQIVTAVTDELASAGADITRMANEARKGSVTTQDFLNEATKIMDLIRQKGNQKAALEILREPENESDTELVTDEFADSTKENFSRPPSREGPARDRRMLQELPQDPRVVSHLRKYAEEDSPAGVLNSSMVSLNISEPQGRPSSPQPQGHLDAELQMSPVNIRIRESIDQQRKRKHSPSTVDDGQSTRRNTQSSYGNSTGQSIPTASSKSSGQKGVIVPGKVEIPNQLGPMVFDNLTKTWVKTKGRGNGSEGRAVRGATSEKDPFEDIPDLSIDEARENTQTARFSSYGRKDQLNTQAEIAEDKVQFTDQVSKLGRGNSTHDHSLEACPAPFKTTGLGSSLTSSKNPSASQNKSNRGYEVHELSDEAEHEILVHEGRTSEAPGSANSNSKQPRVATITFSSPLVSGVVYQDDRSVSDTTSRTSDRLTLEDAAFLDETLEVPTRLQEVPWQRKPSHRNISAPLVPRRRSGVEFVGRPVSRIDEQDEEDERADEMSLIHVGDSAGEMSLVHVGNSAGALTPLPRRTEGGTIAPPTGGKGSSLICLTPLSEFTLHQADNPVHLEVSYVAERTHPPSLQQAHGQLCLAVDDMVKAITDVEPYEPYWGHIRKLNLAGKDLTSLHRLRDYCSDLEELDISSNDIGQLSGIPASVRFLTAQRNSLTNLTSWGFLHNLQYLDISDNGLESLEGFSSLVHLRELTANRNRIRNIDGILDLNGLLSLKLKRNELIAVDFEGAELSRLSHLDLSGNALTSVKGLQYLPALETLDLEDNNIRTFNFEANVRLLKLRLLRLSNNELRALDVATFPMLQLLYLDSNKIASLLSFSRAHRLQILSLREQCESPDILNLVLSTTHDCRKLYLSCNVCPPGGLKRPPLPLLSLQYLELASCGLSSLPWGFGQMLPSCRVLNLNFNALKSISPLQGILRLNKLLLAGNRIDRMRKTCALLAKFTALTKIDVRNNPLTIGFYPPSNTGEHRLVIRDPDKAQADREPVDLFTLPDGDRAIDEKWAMRLDEATLMKRRIVRLLLADNCGQLLWVDGLDWRRDEVWKVDSVWMQLRKLGVLRDERDGPTRNIDNWIPGHVKDKESSLRLLAGGDTIGST